MSHLNINGVDKPLDHVYVKARTENLFDKNNITDAGQLYIGIASGGGSASLVSSVNTCMFMLPCKPNTTYTVKRDATTTKRFVIGFVDDGDLYSGMSVTSFAYKDTAAVLTATSTSNSQYLLVYYAKKGGSDASTAEEIQQCLDTMMVVEGSEAPSQYVPPIITKEAWEAKSRVILHGLTNPLCGISTYKDTLDLSTGPLTRYIKKLVLTGQETVSYQTGSSAPFRLALSQQMMLPETSDIFWCCSHFMAISNDEWAQQGGQYSSFLSWHTSDDGNALRFKDTSFSTANDFKQYLASEYSAGHPVTVWYVLATPTTETIALPSNLTGIVEGYLTQTGTPTPSNPIYPTANGTLEQGGTYSLDTGAYAIAWGRADTFIGTNSISARCYGLPVKSWEIDGNSQQSGTPSPDNIIMPTFCGKLVGSDWTIPITSANQTVPAYLRQAQMVRRVKKLVLTGEEAWFVASSNSHGITNFQYPLTISDRLTVAGNILSTHYVSSVAGNADVTEPSIRIINSGTMYIRMYTSSYSTADVFKTYLQQQYQNGTPVTVWYVLATPQTTIVNEPIAKIGTYADTLTSEQAGITIPTADGNNTISVDTALAPSRFEVKVHAKPI